ncbi:DMT family transporter [Nocardioides panacisoli]|uniref:EamA domain-containing protein n=1 Tax=Nocardioides panacisoli TaxID=627624 RepID=A0ABP7IUR8_9ACTN
MHTSARAGDAAILAAAAGWGLSTTISVAALDRVGAPDLVAVELTGGAALLVAVAVARRRLARAGARRNFLLGLLAPGLSFVLGDLGLSMTSATAGSLLLAVELPMSVLLSVLFLREVLDLRGVLAVGLGLSGSAVVAFGAGHHGDEMSTLLGNLLVVASVAAAAAFLVVTRKHNADDGLNASTWQTVGAAVGTTPFVAFGWLHDGSRLSYAGPSGWALCGAVLVCTAVASVCFNWGISRVPGVRASQLQNLTPVAGLLAAVLVLQERPSAIQLLGGVLVVAAIVVLARAEVDPVPGVTPDAVLAERSRW